MRIIGTDPSGKNTFQQDQTSPPFEHYLYEILNNVTLVGDYSIRDNQITFAAGHNFVNPVPASFTADYLVINYIDETQLTSALKFRFYQGRVVNVAGNIVDLGIPLGFNIENAKIDSAYRVNTNMALKNATFGTPAKFFTTPVNGVQWDSTRVMVDMISSSAPDDGLFGGGLALTNGLYFGFEGDDFTEYLVNILDNGGFRSTAFDVNYTTRTVPVGSFGISTRKTFASQDKYGVAIRMDGRTNDQFVSYVQDNLTAGAQNLDRLRMKLMGHLVVEE